ncbi:Receptor-interacting serine/threonine-protein kinase 1 [Mortierella sp. NVP85]|nr:Receptor-interacting serine/threonine-protein kinase 1 [Mortierella sp. NVP85]
MISSASASGASSGLTIRIPRDLPNIPEAFRKRGAIRSGTADDEMAARHGPDSNKRSYSAMMLGDRPRDSSQVAYDDPSEGRVKIARKHLTPDALPPHLANAKNLAIRTWFPPSMVSAPSATHTGPTASLASEPSSTADMDIDSGKNQTTPQSATAVHSVIQKHRNQKSKSNSPSLTPVRIPSPASSSADVAVASPASESKPGLHSTAAGSGAQSSSVAQPSPNERSPTPGVGMDGVTLDSDLDNLKPIELVRVGMGILNDLLSNTFSKSFINKVPLSATGYHSVIKKPMDLTTIERKLWKTLDLAGANSGAVTPVLTEAAGSLAMGVTSGYANLHEFERDLRRICLNATHFNSPTHIIHKEAQTFQTAYTNLLANYRQGKLLLNEPLPQESYRPELISLSEPGPLYLFRAHTLRELERKMTDISTDLYSCFHQPIFDISSEQVGQLSPEHPRFVRMYINKNRSILAKSRDELFARIAILNDIQVGKPYNVTLSPTPNNPASGKTSGGAGGGSISMVRMTAKVLIGKPIGERHDMVTVGDLDCPNAWITVACVRAMEIDLEVPAKFDKGVLSKMRHEVVAYSSESKISPEHQRAFAEALGLLLPTSGKVGQAYGTIGQRSTIPVITAPVPPPVTQTVTPISIKDLGPSIGPPSASATPIATAVPVGPTSVASQKSESATQRNDSSGSATTNRNNSSGATPTAASSRSSTRSLRSSKEPFVDLQDDGPGGRYLVKLRISSLLKASQRQQPTLSLAFTANSMGAPSPPTPVVPPRINVLSSQVSASAYASEMDPSSAPDRAMLNEQIMKRGNKMLMDLKTKAKEMNVPYQRWSDIEPTLIVDAAQGLFKQIYRVRGNNDLVVQNFKEMDAESFEQRVREVACLLKLRDLKGVGQIQSVVDNQEDHLVGLSMTKYPYTLKQYATNARRHPTPCQKLYLITDMVSAMSAIHKAGLAHRDLSEVNIMVDEDPEDLLEDQSPRPHVKVIDFGKSVFVEREEVERWSMLDEVSEDELSLLPMVVLPPDHGYKLYRSILTLPRTKQDHAPLPPVDPRSEDVYSLGVLIWRTFSGKSPWNGAIEDDLKTIRYLVSSDSQIRFQLEREIAGPVSRELLLHCLTAKAETRWTTQQLKDWLERPDISSELLKEFEALGGGRKKVRKNLD